MTETTPHFALPLLHVGQAGKELTHNEALVLIEALLRGRAVAMADDPAAIGTVVPGSLWIVGDEPVGDWAAMAGSLALMTEGGWRFVPPVDGLRLWLENAACIVTRNGGWQLAPELSPLESSASEDTGVRTRVEALVDALAAQGLIRASI